MGTTLADWTEWHARCALLLCGDAARTALPAFVHLRFKKYIRQYGAYLAGGADGALPMPAINDAWQLFETHLAVDETRDGRVYKTWLFDRVAGSSDDPVAVIQGGATLLLRDVVREYLRREHSPAGTVSLQAPLANGESVWTLEELLPDTADPASEAARRECEALSDGAAAVLFETTTLRERVAVLAKDLGLSCAHPDVVCAAGCGKTLTALAWQNVMQRLAARVRASFAGENREQLSLLAIMTATALQQRVRGWAAVEKNTAHLFKLAESSI
ncbi:MAG: hypothetical protein WCL16_05085 [bacterium]